MSGTDGAGVSARGGADTLVFRCVKRAKDLYVAHHSNPVSIHTDSHELALSSKIEREYRHVQHIPPPAALARKTKHAQTPSLAIENKASKLAKSDVDLNAALTQSQSQSLALALPTRTAGGSALLQGGGESASGGLTLATLAQQAPRVPKPQFHPHWKLFRVISGHSGWVRCVSVDPTNEWFVTGSADRTLKIWDLASGTLRLTLTGHVAAVRDATVSSRHPYVFSVSEDRTVKCWDLEQNKVIRSYHGHLSSVNCVKVHPTLDVLVTGGRDCTVRVWDMRTKAQVHCLQSHQNTVASIITQGADPQIISGSHDQTIKLWDLAAGKVMSTLTNHKKSVRALALHPKEFTFASGAPDNIKQWYLPDGKFIQNLTGHNSVVNTLTISADGVLASGADNGTLKFWDYKTGTCFQTLETLPQPGSLDAESGIFMATFDRSYARLITAEADKTIKMYKEDPESTEETHPVQWNPDIWKKTRF